MKKVRQAAQKKGTAQKRVLFFFVSLEQFWGFIFFVLVVAVNYWIVKTVKDWVDDPNRMVLSRLTVTGDNQFTNEDDVRQAIMKLGLPNTYIAQDVDNIQREIMRLPWIKQLSVRKQWPDRLIVHVSEYHPKYVWNDVFLLDDNATLFSVPMERIKHIENYPFLYGPIGKEKLILETYHQLNSIEEQRANKTFSIVIKKAYADERNSWQLFVEPCIEKFCLEQQNIKLILGREHILERYALFIKLFSDIRTTIPEDEIITEADLRYENGIAVKKEKLHSR